MRAEPVRVVIRRHEWEVHRVADVQAERAAWGDEPEVAFRNAELEGIALFEPCVILLDEELEGVEDLDTSIHELLHAYNRRWSELHVTTLAATLARALWEMGWRRRASKKTTKPSA
jgi:hypothetical protein